MRFSGWLENRKLSVNPFCVKLLHCGNRNILNPKDGMTRNLFYMPMGLFILASSLKAHGFDVEIIHLDLESATRIEQIADWNAVNAVGLDCHWANQSFHLVNLAQYIKKINPKIFVFTGGFTASFFAAQILEGHPTIDAIVRGDGEVPIVELCKALEKTTDSREKMLADSREKMLADSREKMLADVPNLVWRKNGQVVSNPFSYVATAEQMEKLEYADISLLRNWTIYRELSRFWIDKALHPYPTFFLEIGRGCQYTCSFCGGGAMAQNIINNRRKSVVRSPDSAISTIKKAMTYGFTCFYICFDFEESEAWYLQLFQKIREQNLQIAFVLGLWKLPTEAVIDAISKSCKQVSIEISPETGVPELRGKNKDHRICYSNEELERCLDFISTRDNVSVQLYFSHFLPFDTEETVWHTIKYITRLFLRYSRFACSFYYNLSTDPGSHLYLHPEKYDIDIAVRSFDHYVQKLESRLPNDSPDLTVFCPRTISQEQFLVLSKKIELFQYFLSNFGDTILTMLKRYQNADIIADFLQKADFAAYTGNDSMKKIFLDMGSLNNVLDDNLRACIEREERQTRHTVQNRAKVLELLGKKVDFRLQTKSDVSIQSTPEGSLFAYRSCTTFPILNDVTCTLLKEALDGILFSELLQRMKKIFDVEYTVLEQDLRKVVPWLVLLDFIKVEV